jgi:TrmH family RNA methyltransferase
VSAVQFIQSRDNPQLRMLRKLASDNTAYRKAGRFWIEGEHLCSAALLRGAMPAMAFFSESAWARAPMPDVAPTVYVVPDAVFRTISALESPADMGFVMDLPVAGAIDPHAATLILDRVQDAGNVGSMLRSASAFGFGQVIALRETAALWSPKVLRAGMGAHFALSLVEGANLDSLQALAVPLVVTSSHAGQLIQDCQLPFPCAWAMGHEGQGVQAALMARAAQQVRIGQPGGEESLNVAAAAAICLHASALAGAAR